MRPTLEDGLAALENSSRLAKSIQIDLDETYLRLIALAEALPANKPGADKSWVSRMDEAFRLHYRRARRT
jgi:hypothetical protein